MKHRKYQMNKNNRLAVKLIFSTLLLVTTSVSVAEDSDLAYVDSVFKWGAWELDIEPAAGGLSAPTTKALNTRSSKVTLRTNSIAALAPPAAPERPINPGLPVTPPGVPLPPTSPVPSTPGITPINPNVPVPSGGPGGSTAPAPTITSISPTVPVPTGGPGGVPSGGPGT